MINHRRKLKLMTLCVAILALASCGPINFFTRIKKTPREYSENFGVDGLKAPKSDLNKREWIVYSDRDKNLTYTEPGGKIKMKEINFLDPLLVIGSKGEFLRVIKHSPAIVKNAKLADRKKAEYYGWIHRSRLLLTSQAVTEARTGKKMKFITTITDTLAVTQAKLFFKDEGLKLYKDPGLTMEAEPCPLYELVYILKKTDDGSRVLLSRKPTVLPDEVKATVMGWISTQMVQTLGQQLFVDVSTVPEIEPQKHFGIKFPATSQYSPVFCFARGYTVDHFGTALLSPVVDKRDNFVYNVAGQKVNYAGGKALDADMKRINLVFVLELGEKSLAQFPNLVNIVQSSGALFPANDSLFAYRFGAVVAARTNAEPQYDMVPLTPDFSAVVDKLVDKSGDAGKLKPINPSEAWSGLDRALDLLKADPAASNIIVLVGEKGGNMETSNTVTMERMAASNCRLLSFQLFAGSGIEYNNFVLQSGNLIEGYAKLISQKKQQRLFYADQLRLQNAFKETGKNAYKLDFPDRSSTQGSVVFPEKEQTLSLAVLQDAIKDFAEQVKSDNKEQLKGLHKSFESVGNQKDKYDSLYAAHFALPAKAKLPKGYSDRFTSISPLWYQRIEGVHTIRTDSTSRYQLLLSEGELEGLKVFMDKLVAKEVDVKGEKGKKASAQKNPCNTCDEPYLTVKAPATAPRTDTTEVEYASTRKIRKYLKKMFIQEMTECKLCKRKKREIKRETLSNALMAITAAPANNPLFYGITIKDVRKRKVLTDQQLDQLIEYLKKKKDELEAGASSKVKISSAGQDYYWIDSKLLP